MQQILIFINQITDSLFQTDVIYFDITDTVSYSVLLEKLWLFAMTQ